MPPLPLGEGWGEGRSKVQFVAVTSIKMPPKIKELVHDLEMAGFVNRGGKGSHRNYEHPNGSRITIAGQLSDDAKRYQIIETKKKIAESKQ
jgi:predicted RNA binding protein YcfA (HicA-like mRNA interferase family)